MDKIFLKILIPCSAILLLLSLLNILYNKRGEVVLAQENKTNCTSEIPIGDVIDETKGLIEEIIGTTEIIIKASDEAAASGTELTSLADQCRAENCQTGCNSRCQENGDVNCGQAPTKPCCPTENPPCPCDCQSAGVCGKKIIEYDSKGKPIYQNIPCQICKDYIGKCDVLSCSGNPCPTDKIQEKISQIEKDYLKIKVAYEGGKIGEEEIGGIKKLLEKPAEIFPKLGESRNKLKACSSPTEDYQKYLSGNDFSTPLLLNCANAKSVDSALGDCNPNNYFCCE